MSLRVRLTGVIAAALLAACLPFAAAHAKIFDPKTFTLDNGMQVVLIENHRSPIVVHMVWYKVGAADEPWGKSGIAHYLEHLMFKSTTTMKSGEFTRIIARNGGQENAFTSWDYTGYFQRVAADRLELMMKHEADRMVNLTLDEKEVLPERDVILEERRSRIDNRPGSLLGETARAAFWENHPYGIPIIGWAHEIAELTREDALDFYKKYYNPANAILIVAGDVTLDKLKPLAEKYYGVIPGTPLPKRVRPKEPPHHAPRRVTLRDARAGQPSWSKQYLAPSYSTGKKEYAYALDLLAEILGGGSTSRLYRKLAVEQKIAANAGGWYGGDAYDLTTFGVWGIPRPGVKIEAIEKAIQVEIDLLLKDGITPEELQNAKDRMMASTIYSRDSLETGARIFGSALTSGLTIEDVESWPEKISAVTAAQVLEAARHVLVEKNSVVSILLPEEKKPAPKKAAPKKTEAPKKPAATPAKKKEGAQ